MTFTTGGRTVRFIEHTPGKWAEFCRSRSPIVESIVPLDSAGRSLWGKLDDSRLARYARKRIESEGISTSREFAERYGGLREALRHRGLWEEFLPIFSGVNEKEGIASLVEGLEEFCALDEEVQRRPARRKRRPPGYFDRLSDEQVVEQARSVISENGVSGRTQMQKIDYGLYKCLKTRGLLDEVGLSDSRVRWSEKTDDEILEIARATMKKHDARTRNEIRSANTGLYEELLKRGLMNRLDLDTPRIEWGEFSEEELIARGQEIVDSEEIQYPGGLLKKDLRIYRALESRGLLGRIEFYGKKRNNWAQFSDEEIVEIAQRKIEEGGYRSRADFSRKENPLNLVLCNRGLLDQVTFPKDERLWARKSDDELMEYAQGIIDSGNLPNQAALRKADGGLGIVLRRRKLMGRLSFRKQKKNWKSYSDAELVGIARKTIREGRISTRTGLRAANAVLHKHLCKRKLMGRVFSDIEGDKKPARNWAAMSDEEIIGYARRLMKKRGIRGISELIRADSGLCNIIRKRELIDAVGFERKRGPLRDWTAMSDDELAEYARKFLTKEGITRRIGLRAADSGLNQVLRKRGLIDLVFSSLEQNQEVQGVQELVEAIHEFGGEECD